MTKFITIIGPFLILAFYIGLIFFVRDKIPDSATLKALITDLYNSFGYQLIFVGAIAEATFPLGFYVPGSTVVLMGAALSKSGVVAFPVAYLLATLGLMCGFVINYMLGRYGWYLVLAQFGLEKGIDEAKHKINKYGVWAMLLGYFFPGSASFLSTAAGVLRIPFGKFLLVSLAAQAFWSLVWGLVAFFFGEEIVEFILKYFVYVVLVMIVVWVVRRYLKRID